VRPLSQRIDVLEHAEEIRLRNDQRRDFGAGMRSKQFDRCMTTLGVVADLDNFDFLIANDDVNDLAIDRVNGLRHQDAPCLFLRAHGHEHRLG